MFSRQSPRGIARGTRNGAARRVRRFPILRCLSPVLLAVLLALLALVGTSRSASAATGATVDVTVLNSEINASSQRVLTEAISSAESDGARALVVEINTPG